MYEEVNKDNNKVKALDLIRSLTIMRDLRNYNFSEGVEVEAGL